MLKLFLWLQYLHKKKIVFLSITAVALSVAMLIVVASLFNGFIDAMKWAAVETIGDVLVAPPVKFKKYPLFVQQVEQINGVETATATLSGHGLLHLGKGNVRTVKIWGIEPGQKAKVTSLKQSLLKAKTMQGEPSFKVDGSDEKIGGFERGFPLHGLCLE